MSPKSEVRAEAASEGQIEERLQTLAEMVVYGASRHEVMQFAEKLWHVSRRTAQEYLKKVQERLLRDDVAQDRLFYLKLSQLQRDKLVGLALRYAHDNREQLDPRVMQSLASLITAVRGLLDSRDRAAGEIHDHVVEQLREAQSLVSCAAEGSLRDGEPSDRRQVASESRLANGQQTPSSSRSPSPLPEGGERSQSCADGATPLSVEPPASSTPSARSAPKANGRKGMGLGEDIPESRTPDCADCAKAPEDERALVAVQ